MGAGRSGQKGTDEARDRDAWQVYKQSSRDTCSRDNSDRLLVVTVAAQKSSGQEGDDNDSRSVEDSLEDLESGGFGYGEEIGPRQGGVNKKLVEGARYSGTAMRGMTPDRLRRCDCTPLVIYFDRFVRFRILKLSLTYFWSFKCGTG